MVDRCPNPACGARELSTLLECSRNYTLGESHCTVTFRLAHCSSCRLAFVDPQPEKEVLAALYSMNYPYWQASPEKLSPLTRFKYLLAGWRYGSLLDKGISPRILSIVARMAEFLARRDASFSLGVPVALDYDARILDFGFGGGAFLLALRELGYTRLWGFDVEQNRNNQRRLQSAGVLAYCEEESSAIPDRFFDCVRLEHVLEHLPAPMRTLAWLSEKLRPGGLMVVTVPSIHAWEPIETLADSSQLAYLQLPIHLWHHSNQSLRNFLAAAGLDVVAVRYLRPYGYLSSVARKSVR